MLALAFSCALTGSAGEGPIVITVQGPTIVAFFKPVTDSQLESDQDTNEALSDFQLYAAQARPRLKKASIDFHEVYANSFRLRVGNSTTTFRPTVHVGYYLIQPGRKPHIEYGVMTDSDLLDLAANYFSAARSMK